MLSIVITTLSDTPECIATVASIRETAGGAPEVLIVDDGTPMPVQCPGANRVIHNPIRLGVGPSRTIGVQAATKPYVLICDSHMRFTPGWYERALMRMEARPKTLHCCRCLQLDAKHMDPLNPMGEYHGATINVIGSNGPISMAAYSSADFTADSTTQWYTIPLLPS